MSVSRDVIQHIMTFFCYESDFLCARLVCRQWYHVIPPITKKYIDVLECFKRGENSVAFFLMGLGYYPKHSSSLCYEAVRVDNVTMFAYFFKKESPAVHPFILYCIDYGSTEILKFLEVAICDSLERRFDVFMYVFCKHPQEKPAEKMMHWFFDNEIITNEIMELYRPTFERCLLTYCRTKYKFCGDRFRMLCLQLFQRYEYYFNNIIESLFNYDKDFNPEACLIIMDITNDFPKSMCWKIKKVGGSRQLFHDMHLAARFCECDNNNEKETKRIKI
jgi:hypothetical protein